MHGYWPRPLVKGWGFRIPAKRMRFPFRELRPLMATRFATLAPRKTTRGGDSGAGISDAPCQTSLRCTLAAAYHKRAEHWLNQTGIRNLDFRSSAMSAFQSCLGRASTVYGDLNGCWYLPGMDGLDCKHHCSRSGLAWRAYGIFFRILCFIHFPMLFGSTPSRS